LRFFDEAVQKNHPLPAGCEQDSGNAVGQADTDFPQVTIKFANQRHSKRPAELNSLDVFASDTAMFARQRLKKLTDRMGSGLSIGNGEIHFPFSKFSAIAIAFRIAMDLLIVS
jgi:hypothetical protein